MQQSIYYDKIVLVLKFLYTNHKKKTDIKWNQDAGSSVFLCLQIESNRIVNVLNSEDSN